MMHSPANKIYEAMEQSSPEDILRWAFATFGEHVEIASAFGAEGIVLLDIAAKVKPDLRVFTLDTGFLFPETLRLMEKIEARYGITIERIKPQLTPAEQEIRYGPALWSRDPDACCNLRKIEPLRRKLSRLGAWITSIRRDQTAARASAAKVEWDAKFQLMKINPLADWSSDRVWNYIRENRLSYNPLHDRNYPSIGCTHCTRSVRPGEDPRAGRWAGFAKTECGLHAPSRPSDMVSGITALPDERATVL
jgi:phosphoadenosine phosphosulfate reductase